MEDPAMVPLLLQLLSGFPLLIPIQDDIVISPTQEEFIMPAGVPQLVVRPLTGIVAEQEAFQRELQCYWSQHGGTKLSLPMSHSSNGGIAGVRNGVEIPLGAL